MSILNEQMQELSTLLEKTGEIIAEDYYLNFLKFLAKLGFPETDSPVPLELWSALAQAFADASGYRIGLQAAVLEPIDGESARYRAVGHREVASAEPTFFVQPVAE